MNEVSCRVFEVFKAPLEKKGVSLDDVVRGTGVTVHKLTSKKERIHWSEFCAIMANLRPHFTDEEYVDIGRSFMHSSSLKFAFVIARLAFSPIDIYRWSNKPRDGLGNQMFTCAIPSYRELSATDLVLEITLPEGYEVCWDFFVIVSGNNIELPRLFGLPPAQVELTRIPRGGRMEIKVPTWRVPFFKRIWRILTWPFTVRAAGRELKEAHEALIERFAQLEDARSKLDRQATQLRTAHKLNELAQRDLELGRTLDTLSLALVEEAGFAHAEIKLAGDQAPVQAGSPCSEPPVTRTLLARAGDRLGEVTVTPQAGSERVEREELLALVTPTIAMALENARYRHGLEELVQQRTTELRQARDELAGTVDQLREAQGVRQRFFGNISHEIRTPLTLIMLAVADIEARAGASLDERARARLSSVTDASRKLLRLVDELLLLAAGQENKLRLDPEPTDLGSLVDQLVSAWQPAAEAAGLQLAREVTRALVANVDPVAFERIVSNLVSNAIKYTPRGGAVTITLGIVDGELRLSVIDTGPGISEEFAKRLFGRFERAAGEDRRKAGTGIGLSLVKQLVEGHGGEVAALPRSAGGTEMRVILPTSLLLEGGVAAAKRLTVGVDPTTTIAGGTRLEPRGISGGTIVIAEDNSGLAKMLAEMLATKYTVIVGLDGEEALELVKQHRPQLLITDVDMPRMSGIELARHFRDVSQDKTAPIVILSAIGDLGTRVSGLEAGAIDYVTKPFDPKELMARVDAQFRMREMTARLHRAEQLSAMGILTSGLAHEIRNPANGIVNAIKPLTSLLPREVMKPDGGVAQLLDVMAGCAEQIAFLSRQLLSFKEGKLDLKLAKIPDLVQRAVALSHKALDGVEVRGKLELDSPVNCAPPLLTQVFANLIENAGHAAGRGGWVEIGGRLEGGTLTVEVTDSGPGVPVELRERVFEPFFTTKPPGLGTGLGLPLARAIVHRHGGVLEIRERAARPVFVVELPDQAYERVGTAS